MAALEDASLKLPTDRSSSYDEDPSLLSGILSPDAKRQTGGK
jgi:hypothetical protein